MDNQIYFWYILLGKWTKIICENIMQFGWMEFLFNIIVSIKNNLKYSQKNFSYYSESNENNTSRFFKSKSSNNELKFWCHVTNVSMFQPISQYTFINIFIIIICIYYRYLYRVVIKLDEMKREIVVDMFYHKM